MDRVSMGGVFMKVTGFRPHKEVATSLNMRANERSGLNHTASMASCSCVSRSIIKFVFGALSNPIKQ